MSTFSKTIDLLSRMKETMQEVAGSDRPLEMETYYVDPDQVLPDSTVHNCGTAACVAGYMALAGERFADLFGDYNFHKIFEPNPLPSQKARRWWKHAEWLTEDELTERGARRLFSSIFAATQLSRKYEYLNFLYEHETHDLNPYSAYRPADEIAHLNKDNPTPNDVVDYLDHLIKVFSHD